MTVSDIIKGLLSMTGKKQADLAEVLGMSSKQAMSNKVRMNRWSADDLIKAAELCGGLAFAAINDKEIVKERDCEIVFEFNIHNVYVQSFQIIIHTANGCVHALHT